MEAYEKFQKLKEKMGVDQLLEDIVVSMSDDELDETCEYIGRMRDIDFE